MNSHVTWDALNKYTIFVIQLDETRLPRYFISCYTIDLRSLKKLFNRSDPFYNLLIPCF